jgi:hypothetical protein
VRLATPAELAQLGRAQRNKTEALVSGTGAETLYFQVINGTWMCVGWMTTSTTGGAGVTAHFPTPIAG